MALRLFKDDESHVALEASYAPCKRVSNCPCTNVRGSNPYKNLGPVSLSGQHATLLTPTVQSGSSSDHYILHILHSLHACRRTSVKVSCSTSPTWPPFTASLPIWKRYTVHTHRSMHLLSTVEVKNGAAIHSLPHVLTA
jgi:hypothetical protein